MVRYAKAVTDDDADLDAPDDVSEPTGTVQPLVSSLRKEQYDDHAGDDGEVRGDGATGTPWLDNARTYLGTQRRLPNGRANPIVNEFFAHAGLPGSTDCRTTPWCSAGINKVMDNVGIEGTHNAMARSWLRWGQPCEAKRGAIVVFWRGARDDHETGHVGIVDAVNGDGTLNVLGFNQRDCVCVAKFSENRVLGYRWPRGLMRTKTVQGATASIVGGVATVGVKAAAIGSAAATAAATFPAPTNAPDIGTAIEIAKAPIEASRSFVHGNLAMYLEITLAALTIAGAIWALYGRKDTRAKTGY